MSKRGAGDQLTRENYHNNSDDEEQVGGSTMASSTVMNKRKIAMPKRKMTFSNKMNNNATKAESSFASAFSFAKKTQPLASNDKPAKLKALNAQFKLKLNSVIDADPCVDLSSLFTKYSQYLSDINGSVKKDEPLKIAPVSSPFGNVSKPTENKPTETKLPSTDFNFAIKKTTPEVTTTATIATKEKPVVSTITVSDNKDISENSSSEDEDEDMDVKVEGPTFTISSKPITSDSVFSFGPKKVVPKSDSDSESDIEIKGPQFTIAGTVKSDIFKLKPSERTVAKTEDKPQETTKPSIFNLSETKKSEESKPPAFSFGLKKSEDNSETVQKPAFSFGQTTTTAATTAPVKPSFGFTFGKAADKSNEPAESKKDESTPTPTFSFGKTNPPKEADTEDKKPALSFNFGVKTTEGNKTEEEKKPQFSFGATTTESSDASKKTPFAVGSITANNTSDEQPKTTFNFGLAAPKPKENGDKKETTKPLSAFGQIKTDSEEKKPAFSFGQQSSVSSETTETQATKPVFNFSKPVPAVNSGETGAETKPSFTFGQTANTSSTADDGAKPKPSFNFGLSSSTTPAPSFNFDKPADSSNSATPSGGFKFSLPFEQKSTPASENDTKTKEETAPSVPATEDKKEDNEPKDHIDVKESSASVDLQNGEEDEINLFSQRAKLMVFNTETKSYDSRGVGEMKLLQNKEDKTKIRLLCRSDGMGNILLNTSVVKTFNYTPLTAENENLVKTPTVGNDGKLTTYIVKFKQKADGRSFITSIENAKKDM